MSSMTTFFLMTSFFLLTSASCPNTGPIEDPKTVVTGRCILYKTLVNPTAVCNQNPNLNCTSVAESFVGAFAGREPCNVSRDRYDDFLNMTYHSIPDDKSIFWDDVYGFVHEYSQRGRRRVTLEDTMTGYLVDGLRFCSSPNEEGGIGHPDTQFCPTFDQTQNCSLNAEASFWSAASTNFASKARGVITIMLNASSEQAFSETSYFGVWELPNLRTGIVTQADIWLVHTPGGVTRSTCGSASIQTLKRHLSDKNITSTCAENPRDVLWLLCWDHQDDPECKELVSTGTGSAVVSGNMMSLLISLGVLLCYLV